MTLSAVHPVFVKASHVAAWGISILFLPLWSTLSGCLWDLHMKNNLTAANPLTSSFVKIICFVAQNAQVKKEPNGSGRQSRFVDVSGWNKCRSAVHSDPNKASLFETNLCLFAFMAQSNHSNHENFIFYQNPAISTSIITPHFYLHIC